MFGVAVDMYVGVLDGSNWPNCEISEMKVVSSFKEGTDLVALGASVCEASPQQCLTARIVAIVTAVHAPVDIESLIPIGGIQPATAGIDLNVPGAQARPGMGIGAKKPNRQTVGDAVIDTDAAPASREIITLYGSIIIDRGPIAPAVDPNSPAVLPGGLEYWRLFLNHGFPLRDNRFCFGLWNRWNRRHKSR